MKKALLIASLLLSFCFRSAYAGLIPYDPAHMHYEVTPDQAVASVQAWSGNTSISLTLSGIYSLVGFPAKDEYIYRSLDHQTFRVRCHTGLLWRWTNKVQYDSYQASLKQHQQTELSQSQLERSALAFAKGHYPNFVPLNMQELTYNDGQVIFCSQTATGAWFKGNVCLVELNNFTGEALGYTAETATSGVTIPTSANLSASQAETNALNWLLGPMQPGDPILSAFTTQPSELAVVADDLGQQRLLWMIYAAKSTTRVNYTYSLWVQNNYDLAYSCEVGIDANTGEVVSCLDWLGGKKPEPSHSLTWQSRSKSIKRSAENGSVTAQEMGQDQKAFQQLKFQIRGEDTSLMFPPLQILGHPYFYVSYLRHNTPVRKFRSGDETFLATDPRRELISQPHHRTYQINGQTRRMSAKPVLFNGRCYVPLDVVQAVLGGKWSYDAKAQTVRYDPLPVKLGSK